MEIDTKKVVLILLALTLVVAISGCVGGPGDLSEDELILIKEKLAEATANIDSYKYELDMDMTMSGASAGEQVSASITMTGSGSIDIENQKLYMILVMAMNVQGMTMDVDMEMYMIDDYMYAKTMGQWIKQRSTTMQWDQQNQVEQQLELLKASEIEYLKDETVKGVDCYVFKVTPDMEKYWEIMMNQQGVGELSGADAEMMDQIGDMMKSMSMKEWISKDNYFPMKAEMEMVLEMDDDTMPALSPGDRMTIDMEMNMLMYDYNQPVSIVVPAEADSAEDYSSWL